MKKNFFLILLTVLTNCVSAQDVNKKEESYKNYFFNVYKADSLFFAGKNKESYKILDDLFSKYESKNGFTTSEYLTYLKSKVNSGKKIRKNELECYFSNHGGIKDIIINDSLLNIYYDKYKLGREYDSLRKVYMKKIDLNLRLKIASLIEDDQYYRTYYDKADKEEKLMKIDLKNEKILKDLFLKKIYPNEFVIGNHLIDFEIINPEVLLLHTNEKIRKNFFLPKVKDFVLNGVCSPFVYARMVDQMYLYSGKPQIYGTYNTPFLKKEDYAFYNKNRKELNIGLPSVEYDIWKYHKMNKLFK
ncbi:conserved exported hypothetical protein [Tenacibaculum sediminilitoris]|uniref:hypothetical protein n=1 Tax=Tenacibaculum sediminilitoris TaxID=1820334 RepID=UPI0038964683